MILDPNKSIYTLGVTFSPTELSVILLNCLLLTILTRTLNVLLKYLTKYDVAKHYWHVLLHINFGKYRGNVIVCRNTKYLFREGCVCYFLGLRWRVYDISNKHSLWNAKKADKYKYWVTYEVTWIVTIICSSNNKIQQTRTYIISTI